MRRLASILPLLLVAIASANPPDAAKALADARAQAKAEGKNVLVVFHASWCGWCKKLDAMLERPDLKPTFENSYVILHLDINESPGGKALENPGGEALYKSLGGRSGIPWYAVVSPAGKKLADSNAPDNIGFPAKPNEIAAFQKLLAKTSKMKSGEIGKVSAYLQANAQER